MISVVIHRSKVQKLDRYTHETFERLLSLSGHVALMVSEEESEPIQVEASPERGRYMVFFDPLDGSSNIDTAISIGSIFSIVHLEKAGTGASQALV